MAPGLLLRAYASGYVEKNDVLTVTGPYAYTRNPLYLGSMMIAFGFAAASRSLWVVILLALLFVAIYLPTIFSEEDFLRSTFPQFDAYAQRVPRLLPRPRAGAARSMAPPGAFPLRFIASTASTMQFWERALSMPLFWSTFCFVVDAPY